MISHEYRCIFAHIPKTAGTSIEHKLGHDGEQDHRPIRHYRELTVQLLLRLLFTKKLGDLRHLIGNTVRQRASVSSKLYEEYFKFAIVRNPWARVYSWYSNVMRDENMRRLLRVPYECSFRDCLIKSVKQFGLLPQLYYLQDFDGNISVDYVGKIREPA